ncbi:TPA: MipA/OmpV family protein [Escherichia coli]
MLINRNIVALFALPFMASATASELSIGAGAAYNESPYRGYNENTKAIPLISYEGDSFYVRQTTLGFILSQSEKNELSLTASWMPLEFDPADNDDYAMQQLDKRDSTAMAGVAWYHHERWGTVKASAAADVLDNSNGWVGELSVFHKMQIGRLSLTPALGVLYYDENFSDYYYGISESESRRSGLASYSAQDAWVPYVSLTAKYPIGENVVLMASAGYSELPEEITNSPMIDRNESFTFVTGVSWRF